MTPDGQTTSSRVEQLLKQYNAPTPTATRTQFDAAPRARTTQRLSTTPKAQTAGTQTGTIAREMTEIQLELADMAEEYGKLNVNFSNTVGAKRIYTAGDLTMMAVYWATRQDKKRKQIKIEAAGRRGDSLEILVDKMGDILQDQYQIAVKGRDKVKGIQIETMAEMKRLQDKIITNLRDSYSGDADYAIKERAIKEYEADLKETDELLKTLDVELKDARAKNTADYDNSTEVTRIVGEIGKVLGVQHGIMEGKLYRDNELAEVRRQMLDKSEALQSSKTTLAAQRVNMQQLNFLVDSYNELEIKYRHAREDMLPLFKTQARIAVMGTQAKTLRETLQRMASASQRLMRANADLVVALGNETWEMMQQPLYDPQEMADMDARLADQYAALQEQKKEWMGIQQSLEGITVPAYERHI